MKNQNFNSSSTLPKNEELEISDVVYLTKITEEGKAFSDCGCDEIPSCCDDTCGCDTD